jgi:quinol monooxygenase YgiN
MIFIVVKFTVQPEYRDTWLEAVAPFTAATRAEPGNLWFDWSRSVDRPDEFVLVEAFQDGDAPAAHVGSDHFKAAMELMPTLLARTPQIINVQLPGSSWSEMGELSVPA